MVSGFANANEAYGKIVVTAPAILGGQVTFTITIQNCSHENWHYTFTGSTELFYDDANTTIIREI